PWKWSKLPVACCSLERPVQARRLGSAASHVTGPRPRQTKCWSAHLFVPSAVDGDPGAVMAPPKHYRFYLRQVNPWASYGAISPAFPSGCCPSSIAASRARSAGESPSKAAARAASGSGCSGVCSLVQPLVQPEEVLDVSACWDNWLGCVVS